MDQIKIVCPSFRRAGKILTEVDNMILLVDQNELTEYQKHHPNLEIITHPSLNRLSDIRQFSWDMFGDLFMIDDDIVSVERLWTTENQKLTPTEVYDLIQMTYCRAKSIGAHLFGFNSDPSPIHYKWHKPFMLNGYINGCAIGLIKSDKLYFSNKTTACESHWINLLNAYHHRYLFIDKRFHFRQKANSTFTLPGGQTARRTLQSEKFDTMFLRQMFGESVKIKREVNATKQLHQYQRVLKIRL
jgi:hypothetical protein